MSKSAILAAFGAVFIALCAFIALNLNRVNSDFYELSGIEISGEQKQSVEDFNREIARQIIVASAKRANFDAFIADMQKSGLFESIIYEVKDASVYQSELARFAPAMLDDASVELLKSDPQAFFERSARELYSKFRPLSLSQDFFSLSLHSRLSSRGAIKLDPAHNRFIAIIDGAPHYLATAKLAPKANDDALSALVREAQKSEILISGTALFSALGKSAGVRESSIAGAVSLSLSAALLLAAFSRARIFCLLLPALFGLACGVAATMAIRGSIHILSAVVSTSLIGLMLDYAVHWLGANIARRIEARSIKSMRNILLLGFFITAGGYFVFLFSPFFLLKEIAIFAIAALAGAFCFSYFALPLLLEGAEFRPAPVFAKALELYAKALYKINLSLKALILVCAALLAFLYLKMELKDDVSEYASLDKNLIAMNAKLASIGGSSFDLIVGNDASAVAKEAVARGLADSYTGAPILDPATQSFIKQSFANYDRSAFLNLGLSRELVDANFAKIADAPILSYEQAKSSVLFAAMPSIDPHIAFLRGVRDKAAVSELAAQMGTLHLNMRSAISEAFSQIKINALYLKCAAYALALALLWAFFGARTAWLIVICVFATNLAVLALLSAFGVSVNIFAIFALILSGAVGIDYMIFANNDKMALSDKIFGITLASLTSIISFFTLALSSTKAVALFGLCVSLNIALAAILAQVLAASKKS